jgi:hypothetical protein
MELLEHRRISYGASVLHVVAPFGRSGYRHQASAVSFFLDGDACRALGHSLQPWREPVFDIESGFATSPDA